MVWECINWKGSRASGKSHIQHTPWFAIADQTMQAGRKSGFIPDNAMTSGVNRALNIGSISNPGMAIGFPALMRLVPDATVESASRNATILARDVIPYKYAKPIIGPAISAAKRYAVNDAIDTGDAVLSNVNNQWEETVKTIQDRLENLKNQNTVEGSYANYNDISSAVGNAIPQITQGTVTGMKNRQSPLSTAIFGNNVQAHTNLINELSAKINSMLPSMEGKVEALQRGLMAAGPKGDVLKAGVSVYKDLQTLDKTDPDAVEEFLTTHKDELSLLDDKVFDGALSQAVNRNQATLSNINKIIEDFNKPSNWTEATANALHTSKEKLQEFLQKGNETASTLLNTQVANIDSTVRDVIADGHTFAQILRDANSTDPTISEPAKQRLAEERAKIEDRIRLLTTDISQVITDQRASLEDLYAVAEDVGKHLPAGLTDRIKVLVADLKKNQDEVLRTGDENAKESVEETKKKLEELLRGATLPGIPSNYPVFWAYYP